MPELWVAAATAYVGLVGLFVGSFVNLASHRVPRHESVVSPRSHCDSCGRVLDAIDLLPIAGYLVRGGRCASCRAPIGARQPIVELVSGLTALVPVLVLGIWPGIAVGVALTAAWGIAVVGAAVRRARA